MRTVLFPFRYLYSPLLILFLFFLISVISSCGNNEHTKPIPDPRHFKQQLEKVNKYEVEKESDEISQYILRRNWKMQQTGTGLRYMIIVHGDGDSARAGDIVSVNYKISLMDGTTCYSSEKDGVYSFRVEGEAIESGLHEAIQLMRKGDQAKFILPSHLAHGLHGDDASIPPLSSIIVDLELLDIK